jgi:hypothetical protein
LSLSFSYNIQLTQRLISAMLLGWFSFMLIAPFLPVESESRLPACCRRDGKHHCVMPTAQIQSGTAFSAPNRPCPHFPQTTAVPHRIGDHLVAVSGSSELVKIHTIKHAENEAQYRVSLASSRQERGPPIVLS